MKRVLKWLIILVKKLLDLEKRQDLSHGQQRIIILYRALRYQLLQLLGIIGLVILYSFLGGAF